MLSNYPFTVLVLALALFVYAWVTMRVGAARGKYDVQAPATDGPPEFQRVFRTQMNTLEQIVMFVPALAIFAMAWGDLPAAIVGAFWPIGRILYAVGYSKAPEKREVGFGISFLATAILLIGGLVGIVMELGVF
ncbi:MAG TPA: MAPEG domain-containing protein [Rhodospirillaceae bacterium]|nr:MAPEG domain-containing protein [Candidatus Neomarinimicrobiota bacterium]HCX14929.1 MAPEG domain-containing protein [Rhodospirillaceae bacterium]